MNQHGILYVQADGTFKSNSSYSARSSFQFCKRKFFLERVKGYRSKREGASMALGNVVEAAVVHSIKNAGQGGREKFVELWNAFKESKDFEKKQYAKAEVSWDNVLRIGSEWLQIFEIRFKSYPFRNARFQVPLSKKIFPGTSYGQLTNVAYIDIYSEPAWNHPLLDPLKTHVFDHRGLITDIKTASKILNARLTALDPQLIEYAWMYRTPDVAFLNFVKMSHGMKFKSRVTLLADTLPFKAGDTVFVLEKDGVNVWVTTEKNADAYERAFAGPDKTEIKGKAAKLIQAKFLTAGYAVLVPQRLVSKQVVQFISARISEESMNEMGKVVGHLTVEMVNAHENNFYPMEPGLRYPSEKCPRCDMRFVCSNDKAGVEKFLVKSNGEPVDGDQEDLEEFGG